MGMHRFYVTSEEGRRRISRRISEAKKGRKNPFYGKKHSEASKRKMSEALRGRKFLEEHKHKISVSSKGKRLTKRTREKLSETRKRLFREGKLVTWNKGLTKETDERVACAAKKLQGRIYSEETLKKMSKATKEWHKHNVNPRKGVKLLEETKRKLSEAKKGKMLGEQNPFYGKKHSEETKRKLCKPKSLEHKRKVSEAQRRVWADPEYKQQQIKRILKALWKRPTSLELQFINICKKHNLPFEYVGNGKFLIGCRNPDFIHSNDEKICVEVANLFHHSKDYPIIRKKYFAKHGWDCIVFMGNKLDEADVLSKLHGVD